MKNPYHNYAQLESVSYIFNNLLNSMNNKQLIMPNGKNYNCIINRNTYCRNDRSFNIAKDKGYFSSMSYPSKIWTGEIVRYERKEKASIKKDGSFCQRTRYNPKFDSISNEWIYQCYKPVFKPITDDIQLFYEICKDYRQVSAGINHYERQVIVCDFDEDYTPDTVSILKNICFEKNIPLFTYLERHTDSNHYQVGWILDSPFIITNSYGRSTREHNIYLSLIKNMALLFNSDVNYKGWWMKNPNCVNYTDVQWFGDVVNKQTLVEAIDLITNARFDNDNKEECQSVTRIKKAKKQVNQSLKNNEISRNDYLLNNLRNWIWEYIKLTNCIPNYSDVIKESYKIAEEVAIITKKGMQDKQEINAVAKSVYKWSVKKYEKMTANKNPFNIWVERAYKEIKVINTYEILVNELKTSNKFKMKNVIEKAMIVNNEKERSVKNHLSEINKYGISDMFISILMSYLYFYEKKGKKTKNYLQDCEEAEIKYHNLKMYELQNE